VKICHHPCNSSKKLHGIPILLFQTVNEEQIALSMFQMTKPVTKMMEPQVVSLLTSCRTAGLETLAEMIERVLRPMIAIITPANVVSGGEREGGKGGELPKRMECMVSSSVMQCQVLNIVITAVIARPEVMVVERDLSKVKTRWRTVAVAMSMERSSPSVTSV
jgi:hypothetical protein